ncbi:nitrilase and fragile histidine triad fusion protein NitFhit [Anopheles cruzii]|uniref:nitrilase and fragile histidine triad fusion protein NitFhit n=1 Tax=Anopheles cruzii TaxID=68878 RepID=UPI0022EC523C|nr:nitrilase and fragile histidine triad fusion protein NitFhit [Anopheles cruzii]
MFSSIRKSLLRLNVQAVRISAKNSLRGMALESSRVPRIAVAQMRATNDKQHNLMQVQTIVERAKAKDVQFIFFPECCDYVGTHRAETLQLSEPLTGSTVQQYKQLAQENNIWLSFGGIHESIIDSADPQGKVENIFNTHIVINNDGVLVASYRKLHLFNVVTPEFKFRESETVKGGPELVPPVESPVGRIGLQICYDMRFAEASTILRKQGAEILTYPSAFAVSTGRAHWEVLLRARAIENQCFVVAAAQIGFHNKKRESYGHAMVVNPWGEILAEAGDHLDVVVAELDFNKLRSVRSNMPCFDHRRDDVYNLSILKHLSLKSGASTKEEFKFGKIPIHPETIFYVSEHCFAFTNIRCVVPGHVLVTTRRPAARLPDLTPPEISDFFQVVCKVQKVAERLYDATSSTVTVQDGPEAGQTVFHVHCHVMPRHVGDFPENDQIYGELNRHDKEPERPKRTIEEMIAEAKLLSDELSRMGL